MENAENTDKTTQNVKVKHKETQPGEKTIRLFATLRDLIGKKTLTIPFEEGQTVRQLVDDLGALEPKLYNEMVAPDGALTGAVRILVRGYNIDDLEGLDTIIKADDQVVLMPPNV